MYEKFKDIITPVKKGSVQLKIENLNYYVKI